MNKTYEMKMVTCKAPVNIAVIKYWGKRDEKLILPLNDSISLTLNSNVMRAKTTVAASPDFEKDQLWLNGREEEFSNPRVLACIKEVKERAGKSKNSKIMEMKDWKLHICSENNFPTAAGLASSAAGYACLVYSLGRLFEIEGDLSEIARQGSGSACRSIHGGFVIWKKGKEKNGSDSVAEQIAPSSHWKEMRIFILIIESGKKPIGSTEGMQRSVNTSDFLKSFPIDQRVANLKEAILAKDFPRFAEITMRDSNRFHSVCQDTYPPIHYLNDTSHFIIQLVHCLNDYFGKPIVAYTFDAGPNACLFLLEENASIVMSVINHFLPPPVGDIEESYFKGTKVDLLPLPSELLKAIPLPVRAPGSLKGIIHVDIGDGPECLPETEHLLNEHGEPI